MWDLRSFKKPLVTRTGLATLYPQTNAIFSPDNKYVVTGAGATSKGARGHLLFMQKDTLETVKDLEVESTPVKVYWHSKINQVCESEAMTWRCYLIAIQVLTGLSNGQICVLYSPDMSANGAKLLLNKGPPRKATVEDMSDAVSAPTIITPHALPMFRDSEIGRSTKRKREKERMDPQKSRRPELPVTGPGRGGRVGASATQHVVQNLVRDTTRDEDVSSFLAEFLTRLPPRLSGHHLLPYLTSAILHLSIRYRCERVEEMPWTLRTLFARRQRTICSLSEGAGAGWFFPLGRRVQSEGSVDCRL